MPQKHHVIHGRDHLPWGADPIPTSSGVTFRALVEELATTNDLLGYWRLGDGASPYADTSGHPNGPADATKITGANAMTPSITGALSSDDDGAVQFNDLTDGDYLRSTDPYPHRFMFNPNLSFTVAAWVKPLAGTHAYPATIAGDYFESTSSKTGWRIGLNYPALTPFFQRRINGGANIVLTGSALDAGDWAFVVGSFDTADGHNLYVDGALIDSDPAIDAGTMSNNTGVSIGEGDAGSGLYDFTNYFLGGVDEVTVWGVALTPADIARLSEAGGVVAGGSRWYHGAGTPTITTGDYYLDTATGDIYYRSGGSWGRIWEEP